jgi:hypothetical protein
VLPHGGIGPESTLFVVSPKRIAADNIIGMTPTQLRLSGLWDIATFISEDGVTFQKRRQAPDRDSPTSIDPIRSVRLAIELYLFSY